MRNGGNGDNRIDALEQDISELGKAVSALAKGQESLASSLVDFKDSLNQLANRVNTPQRIEWGVILGAIALTGTLGLAFLTPVKEQATSNQLDLRELSAAIGDVNVGLSTGRERGKTNREALIGLRTREREQVAQIARLEAQVEELRRRR